MVLAAATAVAYTLREPWGGLAPPTYHSTASYVPPTFHRETFLVLFQKEQKQEQKQQQKQEQKEQKEQKQEQPQQQQQQQQQTNQGLCYAPIGVLMIFYVLLRKGPTFLLRSLWASSVFKKH